MVVAMTTCDLVSGAVNGINEKAYLGWGERSVVNFALIQMYWLGSSF